MATVLKTKRFHPRVRSEKTGPQKVCITVGYAFLVIGVLGVILPGILGMHLSMLHNLIHILVGALALWAGYTTGSHAFNFCLGFGAIYGFLGIIGFILGEPGYPAFGYMEADQNLLRILPGFLEFGTMDHLVHLLIGAFLLFNAYVFRKDRTLAGSRGSEVEELNRKTTLGESDFIFRRKK